MTASEIRSAPSSERFSAVPSRRAPIRSESTVTENRSLRKARCVEESKRDQSAPRTTRRIGSRTSGLVHAVDAPQCARRSRRSVATSACALWDKGPSGKLSSSRRTRPSNPPKFARRSVERLFSRNGTSMPPAIASHARQPVPTRSKITSSFGLTRNACPAGSAVSPLRTVNNPPHQAIIRSS